MKVIKHNGKIDCLLIVINMKAISITNNCLLGNQWPQSAMQSGRNGQQGSCYKDEKKKMMRKQKVNKI